LRTQQPEFMTQLVSAARIGRSLGIHLILATQKPAGVVDDQIWSNSRFRVCLKVQDKADSQDMLKRPDAAELTQAGRFYLQVGYNELFEMGQSAWAGAPYYPQDRFTPEKDDAVVIIDSNGRPIRAAKPDKRDSRLANPKKQLDAITEYLKATADKENISIRPLWLEPIPAIIFLDDIKRNNNGQFKQGFNLNPIIGQYDDPSRQRQCTLTLPLTAEGNTIIYGSAGSGKTTFLNALITSLTQDHTPDEVNIYILDFSAETLRAFAQAPHIGDVVFSFEAEKIENLLRMLREETHNRKALFADYGGDFITYMKTTQPESRTPNLDQRPPNPDQHPPKPEPRIPSIVLIIHDFGIFSDIYEHKLRDIMNLTRESAKYGIYVILTALSINAVRAVIRQNFKQLFSLQMNEAEDYFSIVGKTEGLLPAKHKGRGLVRLDGLYEYQIAHLTEDPIPYGFIQTHSRQLQDRYPDVAAPPIPIMPEHITPEDLAAHIQFNTKEQTNLAQLTLPIGIECDTIKVHNYPFGRNPVSLVVSAQPETHFLQELATLAANHCGITTVIIDPTGTLAPKDTGALICVSSKETCENVIKSLGNLLTNRLSTGETSASQGQKHEPLIVIITAYTPLQNIITEEARGDLILFLERTSITHNTISIIGELAQDIGKTAMTPWYAKHSPGTAQNYIWAGSGLKEQYTQAITPRPTTEQSSLSPEFAYSISKGRQMTKIKLLGASSDNGQ
ncbi:MAG: FtsK/SpoIIIE domain-containing protein, partial [Peptococcaceae bacterium]|nr:FtsK/SpoIIIE domain-containing protein [Peptococcaceae bacterium]